MKTEQAVQGLQAFAFCVVNVNSTVVFKHFEDLKDFIILNILKEKLIMSCLLGSFILILYKFFQTALQIAMISKVMVKFRSKFQFQILLQFHKTVEKVETWDDNGQTFWQVPTSFQTFHLLLFCFSWWRFKNTENKGTLT